MAGLSTTLAPLFIPEPPICKPGGRGVILPLLDAEQEWDNYARGLMYVLALAWCFLGVAHIADVFMESIVAVTSKRKTIRLQNGQVITTKVWNDTVSNLSLMALGSSAPEILLNVVEISCRDFFSGDLGPSTIVGSAAFNLMIIIAVCVIVIPDGEARTIKSVEPFLVTAVFSIFAYLWMVFVLSVTTPDIVTLPEAFITLAFFPILIFVAYLADVGCFTLQKDPEVENENVRMIQQKAKEAGFELTTDETKMLARLKTCELGEGLTKSSRASTTCGFRKGIPAKELSIGFISAKYCFPPSSSELTLMVEKFGEDMEHVRNTRVSFEYRTTDGVGMRSEDPASGVARGYISASGVGEIPPGDLYAEIPIRRLAGMPKLDALNGASLSEKKVGTVDSSKPAYYFNVEIVQASKLPAHVSAAGRRQSLTVAPDEEGSQLSGLPIAVSPDARRAQVAIEPSWPQGASSGCGKLCMDSREVEVPCPQADTLCKVKVRRIDGSKGEVSCRFYTEEESAKAGMDYLHVEGELCFGDGVVERVIEVPIFKKIDPTIRDKFLIVLEASNGRGDVLSKDSTCTATIFDEESEGVRDAQNVLRALEGAEDDGGYFLSNAMAWADQFTAAFNPRGGDEDDVEEASASEWTLHIFSFPWKILFALVPPPSYCGGWLCFWVALMMVGGVTIIIGDLATLLGCVLNINGSITAITIVALGTSLPDTFASKVAAVEDPTADAAIGNVTGSNSVNVFLGLGLPWVIGTVYWEAKGKTPEWLYRYPEQHLKYPDGGLVVLSSDLAFSVSCFTLCALTVLGVLFYRRHTFQAELGGPHGAKVNTAIFLVLLWIFYVCMASWKVIKGKVTTTDCVMTIFIGLCMVVLGMFTWSGTLVFFKHRRERRRAEMKEVFEEVQAARDETIGAAAEAARLRGTALVQQPNVNKGGPRMSLVGQAKRASVNLGCINHGSLSKGSPRGALGNQDALLAVAPGLLEGLRLKLPEAVVALRRHLDALNVVCTSLESQSKNGEPDLEARLKSGSPRPPRILDIPMEGIEEESASPDSKRVGSPSKFPSAADEDAGADGMEEGKPRQTAGSLKKKIKRKVGKNGPGASGAQPMTSITSVTSAANEDESQEFLGDYGDRSSAEDRA